MTEGAHEMKLRELIDEWLQIQRVRNKPTTASWYAAMATHLRPIYDVEVTALTRRDINPILDAMVADRRITSARGVYLVLSGALALEDIAIPKGTAKPRKADTHGGGRHGVWTADEAGRFLAATAGDRLAAAWALAVVGGMRRGELAGLRWNAVNFGQGEIYIRSQRTALPDGRVHEGDPKGTSTRTLPLGPVLAGMMAERRTAYLTDAAKLYKRFKGPADIGDGYVFSHANGLPYYPGWFTKTWPGLCRAAGVRVIAMHDARHTSATVGAAAGIDLKTMQSRLGHADPMILTRVYLHVVTEHSRTAAARIEQAFRLVHGEDAA